IQLGQRAGQPRLRREQPSPTTTTALSRLFRQHRSTRDQNANATSRLSVSSSSTRDQKANATSTTSVICWLKADVIRATFFSIVANVPSMASTLRKSETNSFAKSEYFLFKICTLAHQPRPPEPSQLPSRS